MSEHQCYEFLALDRPLTAKQMAELRAISTRAEISPTRFGNEYQWGDLKADPAKLMERYFDAHLYFANWGTHRLMLRIPKARVDLKLLGEYFTGGQAKRLTVANEHVVVDLRSDTEEPQYDEESKGALVALSPLRAELSGGDLRSAYLAWLLSVQADDADDDAKEPPVPPGLGELTAAQRAMIEFLRIDVDLVAAAAMGSAKATDDRQPLLRWVAAMSAKEKDGWLRRATAAPPGLLRPLEAGGARAMTDAPDQAGQTGASERYLGDLSAAAKVLDGGGKKVEGTRQSTLQW